jgi:hypothetical protein
MEAVLGLDDRRNIAGLRVPDRCEHGVIKATRRELTEFP